MWIFYLYAIFVLKNNIDILVYLDKFPIGTTTLIGSHLKSSLKMEVPLSLKELE